MAATDEQNGAPEPQDGEKKRPGRAAADAFLIGLLAAGARQEDAALQAGVSVSTITRRLKSPTFKAKIERVRSELTERTVGKLVDLSTRAADTLRDLLDNASAEAVRLGAARTALDLGLKWIEQQNLLRRMQVIEERLGMAVSPFKPLESAAVEDDTDEL